MAAEYSPFTPNGGTQQRPTAAATPLYYIGRNSKGHWVVRDKSGQSGGIFVDRVQAIKFAMFENGRHPEAVIMVPGVLELDLV
jgi:hypothetical protein